VSPSDGEAVLPGNVYVAEGPSELEFAVLRARWLKAHLEERAKVVAESNPYTIGGVAHISLDLNFGGPGSLALLGSDEKVPLELKFSFRRWPLFGGWEEVVRRRIVTVPSPPLLGEDEAWNVSVQVPLDMPGDPSSVWEARVEARARIGGAQLNGESLPLQSLDFGVGQFLILPLGWERLSGDPLGHLSEALLDISSEADPRILCSCALLREEEKEAALALLVGSFESAQDPFRVAVVISGLRFLSQEDAGESSKSWKEWWGLRTISDSESSR